MDRLRVGAASLNQTPLDFPGNRARAAAAIAAARVDGVAVLCLPELCLSGYGCEDWLAAPWVEEAAVASLLALAPLTEGMAVAVGLPLSYRHALYNTVCLLAHGRIAGFVAKQNLAGDGIHYEPRWFKPWAPGAVGEVAVAGSRYPLGDLVFHLGEVGIGIEICEDAWVARRTGASLAERGADLLLNPSASHFAFGKYRVRQQIAREGARAMAATTVHANLLGNEAGRALYDGDTLIASGGELLAAGPRFSYRDHCLTSAWVDLAGPRLARKRLASRLPHQGPLTGAVALPALAPSPTGASTGAAAGMGAPSPARIAPDTTKEEDFTRAVALGLFDYMRKSGARGFCLSLSGGADSAACACLVAAMAHLAWAELGPAGLAAKLPHCLRPIPAGAPPASARDWLGQSLLCAYQATAQSSATTETAARELALALGAEYHRWDLEPLVQGYVERAAAQIRRPLTFAHDDLALQNIQARTRSPGIWLLANLRQALLIATSNRSEAAVGYATMDGDTSGGLAPIAGVDKTYLREWLLHVEREGVPGLGPLPALAAVNRQAPTAELRPPEAGQTDEGDLMPYVVLEEIERLLIRDKCAPAAALALLRGSFPGQPEAELRRHVERFCRLFSANQWKRERLAPSFHIDDRNLDPRSWCRFPILSGGLSGGSGGLSDDPGTAA
jgi:NAD+ synthase (glutamine-hydrolysing)